MKIYTNINNTMQNKMNKNQYSVSFKGYRMNMLKQAVKKNNEIGNYDFTTTVSYYLDLPTKNIDKYATRLKRYKMDLMYNLASKFYFEKSKMSMDIQNKAKNTLFNIYEKVKNPQNIHNKLINSSLNFEEIDNIINIAGNDKKQLSLIQNLLNIADYQKGKYQLNYKEMKDFLSSPQHETISKNFDKYKSFLILNKDKENIVELLEKEIQKGYNAKYFDGKLKINDVIENSSVLKKLNKEELLKYYSEPGLNLLEKIDELYAATKQNERLEIENQTGLLHAIYNSTTNKNKDIREKIIDVAIKRLPFEDRMTEAPLESVYNIFNIINQNEKANQFVNTVIEKDYNLHSIKKLEDSILKSDLDLVKKYPQEARIYFLQNNSTVGFSKKQIEDIQKQIKETAEENYTPTFKDKITRLFTK